METENQLVDERNGIATREALFDLLYGALASGGRREALLGDSIALARRAYGRMAPAIGQVHLLFEMPLVGKPGLDVIFGQNCPGGAETLMDPAWSSAVKWLRIANPSGDVRSSITVMAEADVSAGQLGQTGLYLIHWDRVDLVPSFLKTIGAGRQRQAWEAFSARLPADWKSTYVGVFPGRPGSLLRVNVRPKSERMSTTCAEALERMGVKGASEALSPYEDALARAIGFDCQLDVDETGTHHGTWGLEVYAMDDDVAPGRHGMDALLMSRMEQLGVIDSRWHLLEGLGLARHVSVPLGGEFVPCVVCLRFYSAKVKFREGAAPYGKAYVKGDIIVRG